MDCREFEENLTLLLYGELPAEQKEASEAHAAGCASCRLALDKARRLHALLGQRARRDPSPELLVECRQALDEALDREQFGWRGLVREWLFPLHFRPASVLTAAVTLTVFGFGLGWTLRPHVAQRAAGPPAAASDLMGSELENMRIAGISRVAPDPRTGAVHITMDAEHRMTLEGSLDDPRIQQVLLYAVKSYDNPGIRRDTLDALRLGSSKPSVRQALLYTMQHDSNVGMRLEALDAVRGLEWGADLRQAFLNTLQHDQNDGVRVAAIEVLASHVDQAVLPALEQLAAKDVCPYVRLKSANAIRNLGR